MTEPAVINRDFAPSRRVQAVIFSPRRARGPARIGRPRLGQALGSGREELLGLVLPVLDALLSWIKERGLQVQSAAARRRLFFSDKKYPCVCRMCRTLFSWSVVRCAFKSGS